jgi:uncharacterized membrane protein YphA (DoxX/SURF4 family)
MTKANKIIYWIATIWLALGMVSTAIVQIFKIKAGADFMTQLGYPSYFLTMIGIAKILGIIAILIPRFPLLKEWAYAGLFFTMIGAIISHIAVPPLTDVFRPLFLLVLLALSYYFRPADRKVAFANR